MEGTDETDDRKAVGILSARRAVMSRSGRPPSAWHGGRARTSHQPRVTNARRARARQRGARACFAASPRPTELIFNSACQQEATRGLVLPFFVLVSGAAFPGRSSSTSERVFAPAAASACLPSCDCAAGGAGRGGRRQKERGLRGRLLSSESWHREKTKVSVCLLSFSPGAHITLRTAVSLLLLSSPSTT